MAAGARRGAAVAKQAAPPQELRVRIPLWTPGIEPTWKVKRIRSALRLHEMGMFAESAMLADAFGRDDRIPPVLRRRVRGLLGLPFKMAPPEESDDAKTIAEDLEKRWPRIMPRSTAARLLQDLVVMGFAYGQRYWVAPPAYDEARGWELRVAREHPYFVRYNEPNGPYIVATQDGEQTITDDDPRWFVIEAGERGYMNGAVRALGLMFLIGELDWRDWARYNERHGMPIVKAFAPTTSEDDVDAFWDDLQALGAETIALLPKGLGPNGDQSFDLELLEARDNAFETFEKLQAARNVAVSVILVGQNLTTEVQGGSFAAAQVHKDVNHEILAADEGEFGDDVQERIVRPAAALMYPSGAKLAPRPTWDITPPEDRTEAAKTAREGVAAYAALVGQGLRVRDPGAFLKRFGIEVEEGQHGAAEAQARALQVLASAIGALRDANAGVDVRALLGTLGVPMAEPRAGAPTGRVFQYHLNFGVLTKNQLLAGLGLDPVPGGDVPPEPLMTGGGAVEAATTGPLIQPSDQPRALDAPPVTSAEKDEATDFRDELASEAGQQLADAMANRLEAVVDIIRSSGSYDEVETRLRELYAELDASELEPIFEQALTVADLSGRHDIVEAMGRRAT